MTPTTFAATLFGPEDLRMVERPLDPLGPGMVRVRFGADQMSPGARFEFHQLDLSADAFGDENTAPIIDELGSALDDLNAAALEAQNGTPDFVSIAGSIDSAKGTLGHAKALIAAAKRDHDLDKSNQPKLAIKALKKGLKRAKQGESIADLLADGNGSAAKLDKRISDATLQAQLALANLLGVKTKSARKIAEHIVVGP